LREFRGEEKARPEIVNDKGLRSFCVPWVSSSLFPVDAKSRKSIGRCPCPWLCCLGFLVHELGPSQPWSFTALEMFIHRQAKGKSDSNILDSMDSPLLCQSQVSQIELPQESKLVSRHDPLWFATPEKQH
jgi:hypothetical protein